MKSLLQISLVLLFVTSFGCGTHPTYTLRHKSAAVVNNDTHANETASVSAFVLDIPESASGKTVSDLPERAQAEAARVLGAKTSNPKDFLANLGGAIGKKQQKGANDDRSIFKKRIVFAIENLANTSPADRFTFAKITLTFPDKPGGGEKPRFLSWDKFATQYQTVDLASLSYTQNSELDFKVTAKPPQIRELTGLELDTKNTRALQEQLTLRQRFITITGSLSASKAQLIQQGAPGIDLAGNVSIDLTFSVPSEKALFTITDFGELFDEKDNPTDPQKLSVTDRIITAPSDRCHNVTADVALDYVFRHVVSGAETLVESDDEVELRKGTTAPPVTVTILRAAELTVPTWTLRLGGQVLDIERLPGVGGALPQPIVFDTFEQARSFLVWLNKAKTAQISGRSLSLASLPKDTPFDPKSAGQLMIIPRVDCP